VIAPQHAADAPAHHDTRGPTMRILLGSSDPRQTGPLRELGHAVRLVEQAEPFEELPAIAAHNGPFDVVVLDVASCRDQALPVLRDIRRRGLRLPVLILASRLPQEEEQDALHAGADDVIAKPVTPGLRVARLHALVRRALGHGSALISCGNVTLDQARQIVGVDGRPVPLTPREFELLETLMLRRGMVLAKEQLMSRLYGDEDAPEPRILDVFVCKLRRKLAAVGAAEILRTVWGRGYVAEEPGQIAVAAARARFANGQPRVRRAHLALAGAVPVQASA
jgi:two-component system cell cycle response regulator CtrA